MSTSFFSFCVRAPVGNSTSSMALALAKMYAPQAGRAVRVWREDDRYYLHAPEFETLNNPGAILERGQLLVTRLNGVLMLTFGGGSRLVEAGNVYRLGEQGGTASSSAPDLRSCGCRALPC
jgi:hypothetical protein